MTTAAPGGDELRTALADGSFAKLLLSKYAGTDAGLERLAVREVQLRGERQLWLADSCPL